MRIFGRIHYVDIDNRIIGIIKNKRIIYVYLKSSQMLLFKRYLYINNYIDLELDPNSFIKYKKELYAIETVYRLFSTTKRNKIIYYDKKVINKGLQKLINNLDYVMVLDLEMTMPPFHYKGKNFKAELIQAGFILFDENQDKIEEYSNYILPKVAKRLSDRTEEFLGISHQEFKKNAKPYKDFYTKFSYIINKYNPSILVYGKNDILVLNSSYNINGLPSLTDKTRFINLCSLIKGFYNLKCEPGLFKLYDIYSHSKNHQEHNALSDSYITLQVFNYFKDEVNQITNRKDDVRRELA